MGGDKHGYAEGARRRAVTDADRLYGRLSAFQRRVDRALRLIADAAQPIGLAFSGGKDSTVCLDLVRRVFPDVVAGFYDSGAELSDTYEFIASVPNVQTIGTRGLIELCRQNGYWGREPLSEHPRRVDFGEELIFKPAREFVERNESRTMVLGLRAGESGGRDKSARLRGESYQLKSGVTHLCPLQWWSDDDVWAYIAVNGLAYNAAYDKMTRLGIARRDQRVCAVLGTDAAAIGRFVYLKKLDPELWNRLAGEFPLIRKYG